MLPLRRTHSGLGLIEQIVVLIVLAVMAAFAIPAFSLMLDSHELRVAQTDFLAALQHARGLAVNGQTRVVLCPTTDGLTCNSDSDWTHGWLVGRDKGGGELDGQPLYVGSRNFKRLRIFGSDKKKVIRFNPDGSTTNSNQTLYFCVRGKTDRALKVVIARLGRARGDVASAADAEKCADED
ncbi:pilus assembly protein [Dyella dinghuensis]|uniref:Type II secretion system protein H n=1 Tax=Dyella dinghuensis TaxID=1920169 RepID=A0A3S0PX59_9GAMM|nr:GspH/FimT family pseudopilin [Dyella dinghuensis]RUL62436.1 pilus assembly protein [Dyella dinghuensis]